MNGIEVGGLDDLGGALERGRDIAVVAERQCRAACFASSAACRAKPSLLCAAVAPSFQVTRNCWRAVRAAHQRVGHDGHAAEQAVKIAAAARR